MNQTDEIIKPPKKNKKIKSVLVAAAILLVGGYLLNRIMNDIRFDDPLYDDSYDFLM
ncbi:MAG: hypothetical protein ABJA57_06575 [Ginsengibacter sp.]